MRKIMAVGLALGVCSGAYFMPEPAYGFDTCEDYSNNGFCEENCMDFQASNDCGVTVAWANSQEDFTCAGSGTCGDVPSCAHFDYGTFTGQAPSEICNVWTAPGGGL